jgi:predicted nucleic acid-binding protein
VYLDSAYIAKYYVNEADSSAVRRLIRSAPHLTSSAWALIEVTSVFQRHIREGSLTRAQGRELIDLYRRHAGEGLWNLIPVTETLLRMTASLIRSMPASVPIRAGDAIHIATALAAGEQEVYTNDRHLLAATGHAGLIARTV